MVVGKTVPTIFYYINRWVKEQSVVFWLPRQESNLGKRIQSPSCYLYTTRQSSFLRFTGAEGRGRTDTRVASQQFLRLSRLPIPPLRLNWSGRRGSNSRPPPWQGGVLPLNYFRPLYYFTVFYWCRRRDLNPHRLSPTTPSRWRVYQLPPLRLKLVTLKTMAGVAGFEPATDGFGDHCSTN